jgi:prepilin-type processing-associated H-X9-DG protein
MDSPASSYAGVHHDKEAPIDADNTGVLFLNSRLAFEDLRDGAAYTFFIGEKGMTTGDDLGWLSGTRATLRNTGAPLNAAPTGAATWGDVPGWYSGLDDGANLYVDEYGEVLEKQGLKKEPDEEAIDPYIAKGGDPAAPLFVGGFASAHQGGVGFAFGDGSVRFISETIVPATLQQLANRKDGKLMKDDNY